MNAYASLEWDDAYKTLIERDAYPSSDAIGDWLRRHGGRDGERRLWEVIADVLTLNTDTDLTLDIDTTLIEADKGDATISYKGIRGYQPLLGIIASNGLIVGSEFRFGNESPQAHLATFIRQCEHHLSNRITTIRGDSAAYNAEVINECMDRERPLRFTITADQDSAVLSIVSKIPQNEWKRGIHADGTAADWEVAETVHTMGHTRYSFRLVVKRTEGHPQIDLFQGDHYRYWIVATNIPQEELDANGVILFHQQRGEMERLVGELKNHFNLDHLPCGQFDANALYFTTGVLAYNIVQFIKQVALGADWMKKSIRTSRYRLFHLSAKVISHARYLIVRIACVPRLRRGSSSSGVLMPGCATLLLRLHNIPSLVPSSSFSSPKSVPITLREAVSRWEPEATLFPVNEAHGFPLSPSFLTNPSSVRFFSFQMLL